jgi:hypothetical protein
MASIYATNDEEDASTLQLGGDFLLYLKELSLIV